MSKKQDKLSNAVISVVVPCFNESVNIRPFYRQITKAIGNQFNYQLVYVNDGSTDTTLQELQAIADSTTNVVVVDLSRNFGKEIATTAGIHAATGDAVVMIDADGQHPPELIPELVKRWRSGAQVVVGVRQKNRSEGSIKRYGSKLFYALFNRYTGMHLVPGSTDFRLIDKTVQQEFVKLTERRRITRGLIDWLGFSRDYVSFSANQRMGGQAAYSIGKLIGLASNSFISLSLRPLYLSLYAGLCILPISVLIGVVLCVNLLAGDPLSLDVTGTGYLTVLILFLVGLMLLSQGIMALYLSHIHTETQNRSLYIINKRTSRGIR